MMYKITRQIAELIGRFEYAQNQWFDPLACEQEDGTYLVGENVIQRLKDHPKVKLVNWDDVQVVNEFNNKQKDFGI